MGNNIKISIHNRNLDVRKKNISKWKISPEDKKDLLKFLEQASIGKVNKGKRLSDARLVKYLDLLKIPLEFFKKPISKLTLKDMEKFEKQIISGKLRKKNKKPFSEWTKLSIKQALIVYLRWKLPSGRAAELTDWLDTTRPKQTNDFLTEQEIISLFKACSSHEERFIIAGLFDSGARAEEFHNLRMSDIELPGANEPYVKITIKSEYSKTEGRTISLYWKNSLEAVRDFVEQRKREGVRQDEPILSKSYDASRFFLMRLGKRILGKSIHYHLFRHSSATYYATKLNRQEMCYRYGWKFSSDMPDVYISRSGMLNKDLDEKFQKTNMENLEKEFQNKMFRQEQLQKKKDLKLKLFLELFQEMGKDNPVFQKSFKKDKVQNIIREIEN